MDIRTPYGAHRSQDNTIVSYEDDIWNRPGLLFIVRQFVLISDGTDPVIGSLPMKHLL